MATVHDSRKWGEGVKNRSQTHTVGRASAEHRVGRFNRSPGTIANDDDDDGGEEKTFFFSFQIEARRTGVR